MIVEVEVTEKQAAYLRQIAFNRFLDNVKKALEGDEECRGTLLAEDLEDIYEFVLPIVQQLTGWNAPT
jgi:hypothetical protein